MADRTKPPAPPFDLEAYRAERERAALTRISSRMNREFRGVRVEKGKGAA
jgi:hypothetical protein